VEKGIQKIVLIGAGNVATHLGLALLQSRFKILQVFSQTSESASKLASKLNCSYTNAIEEITDQADIYIFSVSDDALEFCIKGFPHENKFMVHTAGSIEMDVLSSKSDRVGVIYPLQTFSRQVGVNYKNIPFCLETSREEDFIHLEKLAKIISDQVVRIDSPQREILHIAAVFACNFTNHMYVMAQKILEKENIPFSILHPLIKETLRKTEHKNPSELQTGPAARNDLNIISKHIDKLAELPESQKIYTFISESILKSNEN
jgi:predicted short-subunit dehydrogenase-like oxidoreductase (DUF2520 family)